MKKFVATLLLLVGLFLLAGSTVLAQSTVAKNKNDKGEVVETLAPSSSILSGAAVGAGLGAALTILGAGFGFGKIGAAALESMARQPEKATDIRTAMIIIAALLEGATFFALVVCILLVGKATF